MVAIGAFTAAGVAAWVATSDWRKRRQERDAADRAQAALVVVQPAWVEFPQKALAVVVHNFGTLPILNVSLVRLDVIGQPDLDVTGNRVRVSAVLQPHRDDKRGHMFECAPPTNDPEDAYSIALNGDLRDFAPYVEGVSDITENAARRKPSIDDKTMLRATVWFEDPNGNQWETVFEAQRGASIIRANNEIGAPDRVSLTRRSCAPNSNR